MSHEPEELTLVSLDNLIQQLIGKGVDHPDAIIGIPIVADEVHRRLALNTA
ncbi:MAG: hypothetical protein OXH23_17810 [bacterium]|nr:hypothetical protein [bacterium]